jgi:hypothetical protein
MMGSLGYNPTVSQGESDVLSVFFLAYNNNTRVFHGGLLQQVHESAILEQVL